MRKTKVTHLTKEYQEGVKTLVGIKVETEDDKFVIPVVDVRVNEDHRRMAEQITKSSNGHKGSKFMKQSYSLLGRSYNVSQKK